ncbi:hypothetical protein [Brevibacillus brevis]|uniref:Uncharacterized protein n=1 Tax=Brevibacillus brevis TaxID=1393 RepID=A0ABY9T3H8_BREBE|nr:hypothetical protein [Brevibacillus brevis]WNC14660.1 hypothetical protein RGB73_29035 [Brevibacillus brevis]
MDDVWKEKETKAKGNTRRQIAERVQNRGNSGSFGIPDEQGVQAGRPN